LDEIAIREYIRRRTPPVNRASARAKPDRHRSCNSVELDLAEIKATDGPASAAAATPFKTTSGVERAPQQSAGACSSLASVLRPDSWF
jgi:hypothetical protein